MSSVWRKCPRCKTKRATIYERWCRWCEYQRKKDIGQTQAIAAVGRAIRMGRIPKVSDLLCVDCNKPAARYDHRDYNKPLDVVPVCCGCNVRRGRAIYKYSPQWKIK